MHRCLSCNQTCSISSIFCDACRVSLLERSTELTQEEQPELVKVGKREEGMADLLSSPQMESAPATGPQGGTLATELPAKQGLVVSDEQTNEEHAWSLKTSGIYTVEAVNGMVDEVENKNGSAQATNVLAVPLPTRRVMPRRVRHALLIFCIVGSLALLTDGVLLALSLTHHHMPLAIRNAPNGMISPQVIPPSTPGATPPTSSTNAAHSLLLSSSRLTFSAAQSQTNIDSQTVTLLSDGQDTFSWTVAPTNGLPPWLHLSAMQGSAAAGVQADFTVSVQPEHLAPGLYTATLLVKAFDSHGKMLANSPETLAVGLNVRAPCTLSVTPTKLTFSVGLLSAPTPQTLTLQQSSSCSLPVSWQVSADAPWITFSRSSGTDTGTSGSLSVEASSNGQLIGSYTAHVTVQATDSFGVPITVSPATITVTLTVLG